MIEQTQFVKVSGASGGPFSGFQPPTFEDEEADVGFLDDDDIRLLFDDEEPELTEEELW